MHIHVGDWVFEPGLSAILRVGQCRHADHARATERGGDDVICRPQRASLGGLQQEPQICPVGDAAGEPLATQIVGA